MCKVQAAGKSFPRQANTPPQEEPSSLRKSPQLTPALLAAARQNAQHSTGPRSAAAKQNPKLNAFIW
ncbi:MAG: hypothetical protein ABSE93_21180 [Terriglobia bacterium]